MHRAAWLTDLAVDGAPKQLVRDTHLAALDLGEPRAHQGVDGASRFLKAQATNNGDVFNPKWPAGNGQNSRGATRSVVHPVQAGVEHLAQGRRNRHFIRNTFGKRETAREEVARQLSQV
jgi:hypothetical protein